MSNVKVRAITIGKTIPIFKRDNVKENRASLEENFQNFSKFNNDLIKDFEHNNLEVETKRFCTQPLLNYKNQLNNRKNNFETINLVHEALSNLKLMIEKYNFDYFACCTILPSDLEHFNKFESLILDEFQKILMLYPNFFTSLPVVSNAGINFPALKTGAKIIKKLSDPEPFNNLRFCISANVQPNTPFFPASYHEQSAKEKFSIALEMADEVLTIFSEANTLQEAKNNLRIRFLEIYDLILNICEKYAQKYRIEFSGIDFSPAPFPDQKRSIGTAIEELGIEYFGANGSMLGAALITNAIPKHKEKVLGFSGLMQPVFEDYTIAKRLSENKFNLDSLLLYSTMCGTGLDCIPLPGDSSERELFYILLDICTLSITLNKPLTARLMPIPGKKAGDDVNFDFEYFAPTKVIEFRRLVHPTKNDLFNRDENTFNFHTKE